MSDNDKDDLEYVEEYPVFNRATSKFEWHKQRLCRKLSSSSVPADLSALSDGWQGACGVIDFKGIHYPKSAILHAVFFYVRYAVSYRDLEEILAECGVTVDHATLNRWVVKFAPLIADRAQARKRPTAKSWRMDETYIKVTGRWT